jgi:hypothetical protein
LPIVFATGGATGPGISASALVTKPYDEKDLEKAIADAVRAASAL